MLYERTEDFRNWCMERHDREPVWLKLFDCERCIMLKEPEIFPFFTELEGVTLDRAYSFGELFSERAFLVGSNALNALFDFALERTSGRFTLIEHGGFEGVLFDSAADWIITKLAFSEHHAVIVRDPRGHVYDQITSPMCWND